MALPTRPANLGSERYATVLRIRTNRRSLVPILSSGGVAGGSHDGTISSHLSTVWIEPAIRLHCAEMAGRGMFAERQAGHPAMHPQNAVTPPLKPLSTTHLPARDGSS